MSIRSSFFTLPTIRVINDVDDIYNWSSIVEVFDPDTDVVTQRTITRDDGTQREFRYDETGVLTTRVLRDAEANLKPYEKITFTYDATGEIAGKEVEFDNGVRQVSQNFEGSSYRNRFDEDDVFEWSTKTWSYDNEGTLTQRSVFFDDGARIIREFDQIGSDVWEEVSIFDGEDDRYNFSSFEQTKVNGEVVYSRVTKDSGLRIETGLTDENGLKYTFLEDLPVGGDRFEATEVLVGIDEDPGMTSDAFVWATTLRVFDEDGNMQARLRTMDDNDATAVLFAEDGSMTHRLRFESDNLSPGDFLGEPIVVGTPGDAPSIDPGVDDWLFQLQLFDETGALSETKLYYSIGELLNDQAVLAEFTAGFDSDGDLSLISQVIPDFFDIID
ncbi:hypothetical protein [Nereida sp. MMG025]|uniref:hypothetical protein n=1 Tax=Nereida sp. MMG025 TaxID=2909981 RepID=UPI001F31B597|nr:hypothetical protein [Nereida sp. MMG025]MCF6443433.1 hypothetical protein [Nereida sp. MMG025]